MMKIRSIYDGERFPVVLSCGKGLTQQCFKDECDINNIIARYEQTGLIGDGSFSPREPMFGDYSEIPDFQVVRNQMAKGVEIFESLPARVRQMFDNDVALYCEFIANRDNLDEACELGLVSEDFVNTVKSQEAELEAAKAAKAAAKAAKASASKVSDSSQASTE